MAGQFVLRSEGDANNPSAARLYGRGITQGRTVFYKNDGTGSQTYFLAVLAEGARFSGDLGCDKIIRVYYAGFELPEFTSGVRNWKFHKGTIAKAPNYKPIQSIDTSTNIWRMDGHGYASGDLIAFHARGTDVVMPAATSFAKVPTEQQFMAYVTDANHIKVLNQVSGAPDTANTIDVTDSGTHLDRIFVYKADALYFDAEQGRPEFFPTLNFTFSGLSYIEVRLPLNLSTGEDEPSALKVIMNGKLLYEINNTSGYVTFDTGTITGEPNPALVAADMIVNDAKMPLTRLHGASFVAWRDRADQTIDWEGGAGAPARRSGFSPSASITYDPDTGHFAATADGGYGYTEQFSDDNASIEFFYRGGVVDAYFALTNVVSDFATKQGVAVIDGVLYARDGNTRSEIVNCSSGDRIKVAYESGIMNIYKNSIPMPLVNTSQSQHYLTYYMGVTLSDNGDFIDDLLFTPSGNTTSAVRQIKRFYGGLVAPQPTPVADLFETLILLSGGSSWADIDGQVRIAPEPDRTPCFTFTPSNTWKITSKRKQDADNFWSYSFRDLDDPILTRKFVTVDRKERRAALGGRLIKSGLQEFSVLTQSQMERLAEEVARLQTDLDAFFSVEAFLDSIEVVRGAFVNLVSPEAGYTADAPALCMVNEITYQIDTNDVENITYELQVITPDFYSDTAHGAVTPSHNAGNQNTFTPPYPAVNLILSESLEPMPDNRYVSSISGLVQFGSGFNQHGRVFTKALTEKFGDVSLDSSSDVFTMPAERLPIITEQLSLGSSADDMPAGASYDSIYYAVSIDTSARTFKLSKSIGGTPENFTSNGSALVIFAYAGWVDSGIDVFPDAALTGGFEIIPARKGLTVVRVESRSAADISASFTQQLASAVLVSGDSSAPLAPPRGTFIYDGVNIRWDWLSSPTFGVSQYVVKDEADRFITATPQLSYAEPARAESVTRRIYAVNSSGVLSSGYAEVTFFQPPLGNWSFVSGMTLNPDGSLTSTAPSFDFENNGATFSLGLLTDAVDGRVTFSPASVIDQRLDLRSVQSGGTASYEYAFQFDSSGFLTFLYNDYGVTPIINPPITYEAGQKFIFRPSTGEVWREDFTEGYRQETPIYGFLHPLLKTKYPLYVRYHLYHTGDTGQINLHVEGDLVPSVWPIPPAAQNLVNVTYASNTLTSTGGTGWGSAGASFPNPLPAGKDGGWTFRTSGVCSVGIDVTDTDQSNASIRYRLDRDAAGAYTIYANGVSVASGSGLGSLNIFVGRENGQHVFRIGAELVYAWTDSTLYNADVVLDTAFRNDLSAGSTVLMFGENFAYNGATALSGAADNGNDALVGVNNVSAIPPFALTPSANPQVVTVDSSGAVVSADSPTATSPVTLPTITGADTVDQTQVEANLDTLKTEIDNLKTQLQSIGILV